MAFVSVLLCFSEFIEIVNFDGSLTIKQLYFKYFKIIGIFFSFCLETETSDHLGLKRLPWPNTMTKRSKVNVI